MSNEVEAIWEQIRQLPPDSVNELIGAFYADADLREDLLDYAAMLFAEVEGGEPVELEEFIRREGLE